MPVHGCASGVSADTDAPVAAHDHGRMTSLRTPWVFATLGPAGSNHHLNAQRYIDFHGLDARIRFIEHFNDALDLMLAGEVHFTVQVCAHPDVAWTIEREHRSIFLVDTFIGPTKAMGVLTRRDVERPRSVGYMIATAGYFDPQQWETRVPQISNSKVAEGLLAGEFDSGFTAIEVAEQHTERFRVDKFIGEVDVAWLVYGRRRVREGQLVACKDSPLARTLAPSSRG